MHAKLTSVNYIVCMHVLAVAHALKPRARNYKHKPHFARLLPAREALHTHIAIARGSTRGASMMKLTTTLEGVRPKGKKASFGDFSYLEFGGSSKMRGNADN